MTSRDAIELHSRDYAKNMLGLYRIKVLNRHRVSALHLILDQIPLNCNMLDIGCGTGHFLYLAQKLRKIQQADGYDISPVAVEAGNNMLSCSKLYPAPNIWVEHIHDPPSARFLVPYNVITMVDVFHHIPRSKQLTFLKTLMSNMHRGQMLIFMDMDGSNVFSNACAILHDAIINHELVTPRTPCKISCALSSSGATILKELSSWSLTFKSYICVTMKT